ncbi:MAG TPA: hypothetical protein VHE61_09005 [Opitutaceae bacterium]|nr:hypothetical protein [Opitutaceae bacterium]
MTACKGRIQGARQKKTRAEDREELQTWVSSLISLVGPFRTEQRKSELALECCILQQTKTAFNTLKRIVKQYERSCLSLKLYLSDEELRKICSSTKKADKDRAKMAEIVRQIRNRLLEIHRLLRENKLGDACAPMARLGELISQLEAKKIISDKRRKIAADSRNAKGSILGKIDAAKLRYDADGNRKWRTQHPTFDIASVDKFGDVDLKAKSPHTLENVLSMWRKRKPRILSGFKPQRAG